MDKTKIKETFQKHVVLIVAFMCFLVCFIVGSAIKDSASEKYEAMAKQLNDVNNQIESDNINLTQKSTYVSKGIVGGLDKNRWASDDTIITEWIYPAFNFNNDKEYNEHREIYVERLGNSNDFVLEVLPPYIAGYTDARSELATIDDGSSINMKMTKFQSYVDGFKDDVYSYVALVTCSSTSKSGNTNVSDIILTYSINGKGEVLDFFAATPYIKK